MTTQNPEFGESQEPPYMRSDAIRQFLSSAFGEDLIDFIETYDTEEAIDYYNDDLYFDEEDESDELEDDGPEVWEIMLEDPSIDEATWQMLTSWFD